jgi:hypothetical protein
MRREEQHQLHQEAGIDLPQGGCINWRWIIGFLLYAAGQGTEAAAYSYAGQALVATLTQLSQATNAIVAYFIFGEAFSIRPKRSGCSFLLGWDLGAIAVIIGGVTAVALTAPPLPCDLVATPTKSPSLRIFRNYFEGAPFLFYLAALFAVVIAVTSILYHDDTPSKEQNSQDTGTMSSNDDVTNTARRRRQPSRRKVSSRRKVNGLLYGVLAAVLGALTTTFVKPSVTILTNLPLFQSNSALARQAKLDFTSADSVYTWLLLSAFLIVATANIISLNLGMSRFDSLVVYPVYSVGQTVLASISGGSNTFAPRSHSTVSPSLTPAVSPPAQGCCYTRLTTHGWFPTNALRASPALRALWSECASLLLTGSSRAKLRCRVG